METVTVRVSSRRMLAPTIPILTSNDSELLLMLSETRTSRKTWTVSSDWIVTWEMSLPRPSLYLESHFVSSQVSGMLGSQEDRAKLSCVFPVLVSPMGKDTHCPNRPVWESEGRSREPPWTAATVTVAVTSSRVTPWELTYMVISKSMPDFALAGTVICTWTPCLSQLVEELQCLPSIVT